ncbi:hypothetical protein NPIL_410461 [Nephila pilipes]|uniref:Uncharacterized protein n=1 Tax=Nephila pilipes TaxID=299642 RepID=A0A8X6PWG7_NEPPI|nr:hypothetical protein NPIL_293711 [Nephila pilipes]GFT84123.1 hypothetical protein NPIL_410461 [Nephila pilipes]
MSESHLLRSHDNAQDWNVGSEFKKQLQCLRNTSVSATFEVSQRKSDDCSVSLLTHERQETQTEGLPSERKRKHRTFTIQMSLLRKRKCKPPLGIVLPILKDL